MDKGANVGLTMLPMLCILFNDRQTFTIHNLKYSSPS